MTSELILSSGTIADTNATSIEIRPMGAQLTFKEWFRLFEIVRENNGSPLSMERAYQKLVAICVQNKMALTYSTYDSFKFSYYKQNKRQSKVSA